MRNKNILLTLGLLVVIALVVAGCQSAPTTVEVTRQVEVTRVVEVTPAVPPPPVVAIPFLDVFLASGHANASDEPFKHWDAATPPVVPGACARCHTSAGYIDYLTNGKAADVPAPAGTLACQTCHNDKTMSLTSVTFPSGKVVNTTEDGEARCMTCHQGRESKVSVDKQINDTFKITDVDAQVPPIKDANGKDVQFGFRNVHYFAAGATLYGSQAQMGYEYDGKVYDPKFRHVAEFDTCVACHDQHALKVRVEKCAVCHTNVKTVDDLKDNRLNGSLEDYNGNGDTKEGIYYELQGLQDILYSSIQAYASEVAGAPIVYDGAAYPYFFVADKDGKVAKDDKGNNVRYNKWTARLLKAAYNYQVSAKDPGAFAHNAKYIIELLYDSTADLSTKLSKPVDMAKLRRNDAGHFAGNTEPFRHWDKEGMVPAGCAKCHSAGGLPQFIANNGTTYLTGTGSLGITGVVAQPPANGFMCSTCHDTANFPELLAVTSVPFPSGAKLTFSTEKDDKGNLKPVNANLCIECHQGRESTASVNAALKGLEADVIDPKIGFKNIHYFAAGATLFGDAAKGAYQFDGKTYVGQNTEHPLNQCTQCHDVHALNVKVDACAGCHTEVKSVEDLENIRMDKTDYNGNGDTTEGIFEELSAMRDKLYAVIQAYAEKQGTPIVYNAASYPYYFVDMDKDGKPDKDDKGANIRYNAWTPRLLESAYNYQYSLKDPGAFAHNPKYIIEIVYDSIANLDAAGVKGMTRP